MKVRRFKGHREPTCVRAFFQLALHPTPLEPNEPSVTRARTGTYKWRTIMDLEITVDRASQSAAWVLIVIKNTECLCAPKRTKRAKGPRGREANGQRAEGRAGNDYRVNLHAARQPEEMVSQDESEHRNQQMRIRRVGHVRDGRGRTE